MTERRLVPPRGPGRVTAILATALVALVACGPAGVAGAPAVPEPPPAPPRGVTWHVVGLGDSVTTGAGCDGCTTFLDLYAHDLGRAANVATTVTDLGVDGDTSSDLVDELTDPRVAAEVAAADVVVVTIGANDFNPLLPAARAGLCGAPDRLDCIGETLDGLRTNLAAILDAVHVARGQRPTAVRVTGYWNVFLDGRVADETYGSAVHQLTDELTVRVDDVIRSVAEAGGATYVDLSVPFRGSEGDADDTPLLAPDGAHPSQAGHRSIADALSLTGSAPLPDP